MKKFVVSYYDKYGDYNKVWVFADDEKDAVEQAQHEYWDIHRISTVYELWCIGSPI